MDRDDIYPLIEGIKAKLFEPETRRLAKAIDHLVEQHDEINRDHTMGFMFGGEVYRHSRSNTIYKSWPMLAWALNEEMEKWLKDRKAVELDRDQIGQMLFRLQSAVLTSDTVQEKRDALPECLVCLVPQFRGLERRFNTRFFLRTERDIRQYSKILPKIEMYAMASLIY
jgi:hypothetical protein